jgi:hypothetical protein
VQVRVAGTDVLLPLEGGQAETYVASETICLEGPDGTTAGECGPNRVPTVVRVRFATTDAAPPIDAITYVDKDGRFVVLDEGARVH